MPSLDQADWVDCYRAWEKPLYNVVYRIVWDPAESQDIVQEAFLRCWRKRDRIHAPGFKALIFKTALNLARSRRRRGKLWRLSGLHSVDVELANDPGHGSLFPKSVRDAINGLPRHLKDALLLTEMAGMTYAEIAATLGIKEGTVGSRRTRALEILRRRFVPEGRR
jgi:RNA polymerase sigma-70 factor (ECF subfamily)